jgi:hypothetical protein
MQAERQTCRQKDRHAGRKTDMQAERQTCRQKDRHAGRVVVPVDIPFIGFW